MVDRIRSYFEKQGFEVCSRTGDKLGVQASKIRLFFIYASFMTLGSPLIIYFALMFVIQIKDSINSRRSSVFDL
ncbi:MAG: PspC domain-containing protein [Schleiferiaceae bacterium]|jgi:phage shock protein PspC (stress-responsive transcriptional regulator)|nr:PspC domain-containing protein [Schleiferiaceae bacterium]